MNFAERYKTYTNTELLRIIENFGDYQAGAVETAKEILAGRNLSDKELEIARIELEAEKQQEADRKEKIDRIKNKASSILDEVNPIQSKVPSADKIINIICIVLGILFCYRLYKEYRFMGFLFSDIGDWDLSALIYFLPIIILPLSAIVFYKRQRSGWILLAIYLTYSAISTLRGIVMTIGSGSSGTVLDFFAPVSSVVYLVIFLFFSGMIWAISKQNIREIYSISKKTMILTIMITAVFTGIVVIVLFS